MATNNTQNTDTTESVTITKTKNGDTTNTTITDNKEADSTNSANSVKTTPTSSSSDIDWKHISDKFLYGGVTLVLVFAFLILASFVASTLGANNSSYTIQTSDNDKTNNLFYLLFIIIIVILIVAGGLRYLFRTSIYTNINNDGTTKEFDITIDHKTAETNTPTPTPMPTPVVPSQTMSQEQVFNIPGQYFGYDKAQSLCKAYGARLATYSEIESAYENGAEWCNYGWSDGQMALYPTQQKTFDELQKIPGHERDCGRPGINGGYMANNNLQFGVNCYGKKPAINAEEQYLMENTPPYPITKKDIKKDEEVNFLKKHIDELLVSPFNNTKWSRY